MLFDADPDYIATLDGVSLVRLLKRLLLAEARLAGVPLRGASVPLQITVPDGGEDGRIEWTGGQESTPYLPSRLNILQSKAQSLNKSQITNEVLKVPKRGPPRLNNAVKEVLANGGSYVVFCRERMVNDKRALLVKAIKEAITKGGENPKEAAAIAIYDANLIADWVNSHPPVALWLASQRMGRNLAGFQTYEAWGRTPDFAPPWKPSEEPRYAPVNRVIPTNERKDPKRGAWTFGQAAGAVLDFIQTDRAIVRVFGPSGFGKSRFVFEVLGRGESTADEIDKDAVVFCDGAVSGEEAVRLSLELADASVPAILVVDECPDDLHNKLANHVKRTNSRLRLVTLDIETKVLQATDTLTIRVERADDVLIQNIAKGIAPELGDGDARFISDLAEGFPRMAVLAAQQDGDGRQTLQSAEQALDRIIWSGRSRSNDAQRVLEIASLFEWIAIGGASRAQVEFLAQELGQMPADLFVEHLLSFKSRGIITRRGDFVQVGPIPLAARLGLARLAVMTPDKLVELFEKAPEELRASLLRRIKWLDTSPTAVTFAERLLAPTALGSFAVLNTDAGAKALDRLVHVAPDAASEAIDRVFGPLSNDELKSARDGRRHLVWALEKLVFRTATFDRSARLLLRLAASENENIGNNASGIFKQLFQLYLSGTEANPAARLRILDDGLASPDETTRHLCVDALGHMLDGGHFSRSGGSEQIGSAEALEDWRPKTYGEIHDFFRAAIARLLAVATSNDSLAPLATTYLGNHVRGLLSHLPAIEVRAMIETVSKHLGFWPAGLTGISHWLYFDRSKEVPKEVSAEIRRMYDELLPTDLVDLAELYTHGWQADLHDPDTDYNRDPNAKHDFEFGPRQAVKIASEIAKDPATTARAIARIACGDGNGTFPFAKALVRESPDPRAIMSKAISVAETLGSEPNRAFFGGLIAGADERDKTLAKDFVRAALQSPKLRPQAVSLIGSGTLQADEMVLVIALMKSGDIKPWQCRNLGLTRIDSETLMPLLEALEQYGNEGLWTIIDIVGMYTFGGATLGKDMTALVKRVLIEPALMDAVFNNMDGYHLQQMVGRLFKLGVVTKGYARSLAKQVLRICRQGTDRVFYDLDDPVRDILGQLIAAHPTVVWDEIAKKLQSKSWHVKFYVENLLSAHHRDDHLGRGLSFNAPPNLYLEWAREKPSSRAAAAVDWLPIAEKDVSGALRWHPELEAFVAEFADEPKVLASIAQRLRPSSWWGGLAPHLEPVLPLVESWLDHPNATVRSWAASQADRLRKDIAAETKRSEEDMVQFD